MEIYLSIYLSICLPTYLPTYLPSYLLINRLPIYLIEGARLEPAHRCGGALLERWTALGLNDVLWIRFATPGSDCARRRGVLGWVERRVWGECISTPEVHRSWNSYGFT